MRFAVLGAGMQGLACAYDLLRNPEIEQVCIFDGSPEAVEMARSRLRSERLVVQRFDCSDEQGLARELEGFGMVISALPFRLNLAAARAAIAAGASFVDMGGNIETVLDELRLAPAAKQAGVLLVPDCGLAPGLANVLAAEVVASLDEVDRLAVRVGGLPQKRIPPWDYRLVFSIDGLINEYTGTAAVLKDWNRTEVQALTGLETLKFGDPPVLYEAAYTSGGSSTLPWSYAGRVRVLDYKTIRYPGHFDRLCVLSELGLFSDAPVDLGSGRTVAPVELARRLLAEAFDHPEVPDMVLLRVSGTGVLGGKAARLTFEMVDFEDEETGLTAMMRTTAFPTSIMAQMIAFGEVQKTGALPPEKAFQAGRVIEELGRRGITIRRKLENT